jgi:HEAT repeat protein
LFEETLKGAFYDDAPWEAVCVLRHHGTPETFEEVFQKAVEFSKSEEPLKRARGINILAQVGCTMENHTGIHLDERLAIALQHLSDESGMVVEAAAWALANMRGDKAISALLTVRHSANEDVRHAVATGLLGETSPEAVEALIGLMQDVDDDVRDYATWSLASEPFSGPPVDSPKIREALRGRLNDSCEAARQEAIWGLAIRKDPGGLRMLLERLEADQWVSGDEGAAEYLLSLPHDTPISELRDGLRRILADVERKG